jgi:trimeric autotransporter adhesin
MNYFPSTSPMNFARRLRGLGAGSQAIVLVLLATLGSGCTATSTSSAAVSAIALSPAPCGMSRTNSVQMTADATFSDGSKRQLGRNEVVWSTRDGNIATVNADGIVVGVNTGVAAITAGYAGATGTLNCTIIP